MPRKDLKPHVRFDSESLRSDSYAVDLRRLAYAADRCGIREPVEVCIDRSPGESGGYEFTGHIHRITIHAELSPFEASKTLWHELTHAAQVERLGPEEFDRIYEAELERIGIEAADSDERQGLYYENRLEREARKTEKQAHIYPLCTPRD